MRLTIYLFIILAFGKLYSLESNVMISSVDQKNIGLQSIILTKKNYTEKISAFGTIIDSQMLSQRRTNWLQAWARWQKFKEARIYSQKDYERQKGLFHNNKNTSQKIFEAAEMEFKTNEIEEKAAMDALENIEFQARLQFGSTIAKWIVDKTSEFDQLMSRVAFLIQVSLPPGKLILMPQKIEVEPYPQEFEEAAFISSATEISNRIQNISYFYLMVPKREYPLGTGLNVKVNISTETILSGVTVPATAVVWWEGKAWVYLQKSPDTFTRVEISTKNPSENGWFVKQALKPGDVIVTVGAQEILSHELSSKPSQAQNKEDND